MRDLNESPIVRRFAEGGAERGYNKTACSPCAARLQVSPLGPRRRGLRIVRDDIFYVVSHSLRRSSFPNQTPAGFDLGTALLSCIISNMRDLNESPIVRRFAEGGAERGYNKTACSPCAARLRQCWKQSVSFTLGSCVTNALKRRSRRLLPLRQRKCRQRCIIFFVSRNNADYWTR